MIFHQSENVKNVPQSPKTALWASVLHSLVIIERNCYFEQEYHSKGTANLKNELFDYLRSSLFRTYCSSLNPVPGTVEDGHRKERFAIP